MAGPWDSLVFSFLVGGLCACGDTFLFFLLLCCFAFTYSLFWIWIGGVGFTGIIRGFKILDNYILY